MSPVDPSAGQQATADAARLAEILDAEGIATSTSEPTATSWLSAVVDRGLREAFEASLPAMGASAPWLAGLVLGVSGLLATAVVVALLVGWRRRATGAGAAPEVTALVTPAAPPSSNDIERLLGLDDAPGALRALWRWVAAGIEARGFAHPSADRTNRELLAEVRRAAPGWERLPTFTRLTNAVDGHLYGGVPLDTAAVRALLPLAEQVAR
ncbi:MAG: DUF4129 domain-containing protein [Pseudomonadota bacterium]|nr:DUF4129 domain-containing protein [Pseudomonadota bacterium]